MKLKPIGKYRVEKEGYKILNPDEDKTKKIEDILIKYKKKDGEIEYDNIDLNHEVFKELVEADIDEYNFKNYSKDEFMALMSSPPYEFEEIMFEVSNIVSEIQIKKIQRYITELNIMQMNVLYNQSSSKVNELNEFEKRNYSGKKAMEKAEKLKDYEPKNYKVKKLNKFQLFLYRLKHGAE